MTEPDFLAKACTREDAEEQARFFVEIFDEVMAERQAAGLDDSRIQVAAEAGRRLREELKKTNQGVAK